MQEQKDKRKLTIVTTGDFCPINRTEELCHQGDYASLYNDLLPVLSKKDLLITNLECPLTETENRIRKKGPHLKASSQTIEALKYANFDIVTLANNHIMDQGLTGLNHTIETCKQANILTVGAGQNAAEAAMPLQLESQGYKISVISAAENEFSGALYNHPGANLLDDVNMYYSISKARSQSDIVLVIVHCGNEGYHLPSPDLVKRLRCYADFGASAIIAHHAHIPTGYEIYKGVPIFYGLGNFIFDKSGKTTDGWHEGLVCKLDFTGENFSGSELIPFYQYKKTIGTKLMDARQRTAYTEKIEQSSDLIRDQEKLELEWRKYCSTVSYKRFIPVLLNYDRVRRRGFRAGLYGKRLRNSTQLMKMLNLFRCDSHRYTITKMLEETLDIP